jgi:hypothetical protein
MTFIDAVIEIEKDPTFANGLRKEALGFLEQAQHHLQAAMRYSHGTRKG